MLGIRVFPGGSEDKASACNARDPGLIPGLERSPGDGNGNPLQYSCLENLMDRGAWRATAHGVTESQTQLKQLSTTFYKTVNTGDLLSFPLCCNQCEHRDYYKLCQPHTPKSVLNTKV